MARKTLLDRFAAKVALDDVGCLVWIGAHTSRVRGRKHQYGMIYFIDRLKPAAHVAWFLEYGRTPGKGMVLKHRCGNTLCVRVEHLEEISSLVNNQHLMTGSQRPDQTLCKAGLHAWVPENLITRPSSRPVCKPCTYIAQIKLYQRKLAEWEAR